MRLAVLLLATIACTGVLDPRESADLRRARSLWESQGIHDYSFEMRSSCFCGEEVTQWAIVEVRGDKVVSARTLSGQPLTDIALDSRRTVDQLFDTARNPADWVANIDFDFDSQLGYPVRVSVQSKRNIADAGVTYDARNLIPASQ